MNNQNKVLLAVGLLVLGVGLLLWQTVFRRSPNAVGVEDMPATTKMQPGTQRDPAAGPIPIDISRQRGRGGAAPPPRAAARPLATGGPKARDAAPTDRQLP